MTISEPTTVATDYLLAVLGTGWGIALWRHGAALRRRAPRLVAGSFLAMAGGAALGGTAHGFAHALAAPQLATIWRATTMSLGVAGFLLLAGAVTATLAATPARVVLALAGLKLGVYLAWMTFHREFYWVILEYGSSMVVMAALMAWRAARVEPGERAAPRLFLTGFALSLLGAVVQAAALAPHPRFNHNDLYHLIQAVALWAFYRGALRLTDAAGRGRSAAAARRRAGARLRDAEIEPEPGP